MAYLTHEQMKALGYEKAKEIADDLHEKCCVASTALGMFLEKQSSGFMNLTPDDVKDLAEYKDLHAEFKIAFEASRGFNRIYVAEFKKEILAARAAKYSK